MRTILTEEENEKFVEIRNQFCQDLANISAKALCHFSEAIEEELTVRLQDNTSLYSPYTFDLTRTELRRLRAEK